MNRVMKAMVELAFRVRAWNKATLAAQSAKETVPPLPRMVAEGVRALAGKKPDGRVVSLFDGVDDEQRHKIVRAVVTLDWFARAGCPIVVLDEPTAWGFATAPPPASETPLEWPLGAAYGLSIGESGVALVRRALSSTHMPDNMREHFEIVNGITQMEAWKVGIDCLDEPGSLDNLTDNMGAAIVRRPDGLTITERHPSRQSARKQGLNPDHVPAIEYVIGSEITLGDERRPSDGDPGSTHTMKVRTVVSPHWTHQPYGPRSSQRRLQWITTHWRGPEDAPVSVHAVRIAATKKK